MDSRFLLSDSLYTILFEKIKGQPSLMEKEVQIHLANILYQHFGIKRVFHESTYRYCFSSKRGDYFSDSKKEKCEKLSIKRPKRCDIRLLDPPAWIELKLNSKIQGMEKDIIKLFDKNNNYLFHKNEKRYSINILTKTSNSLRSNTQIFFKKIKAFCDVKCKLLENNSNEAVVIFHNY